MADDERSPMEMQVPMCAGSENGTETQTHKQVRKTERAVREGVKGREREDGRDGLRHQADQQGWRFPYLLDEQQTLAKDLHGACTPEFYAFAPDADGTQTLRYRGQLDASRPGNEQPLDGADLRAALTNLLAGTPVSETQLPSVGCNIKWNPGQEPPWFGQPT